MVFEKLAKNGKKKIFEKHGKKIEKNNIYPHYFLFFCDFL